MASPAYSPPAPTATVAPLKHQETAIVELLGLKLNKTDLDAIILHKESVIHWLKAFKNVSSGIVMGWIDTAGTGLLTTLHYFDIDRTDNRTDPASDVLDQSSAATIGARPAKRPRTISAANEKPHKQPPQPRQIMLEVLLQWCGKDHCTAYKWTRPKDFYNHFELKHLRSKHLRSKTFKETFKVSGGWKCTCGSKIFPPDAAEFMVHIWDTHMSYVPQVPEGNGSPVLADQLPPGTTVPGSIPLHTSTVRRQSASLITADSAGLHATAPALLTPIDYDFLESIDPCEIQVEKDGEVEKSWPCGCGEVFYDADQFMTHAWTDHMIAEVPRLSGPLELGSQLAPATTASTMSHGHATSSITSVADALPMSPPSGHNLFQSMVAQPGPSRNSGYSTTLRNNDYPGAPDNNYNGTQHSNYNGAQSRNYNGTQKYSTSDAKNCKTTGAQDYSANGDFSGSAIFRSAGTQPMSNNQSTTNTQNFPGTRAASPPGWGPLNGSQ